MLPARVRRLKMNDVNLIYEGWGRKPPLHWLAAAYVGFKPPEPVKISTQAEIDAFMAELGAAASPFGGMPRL
jgi:hypothetical protein